MIIDFHIHLSRPEHHTEDVMDWLCQNAREPNLRALLDGILTPQGIRAYLQEHEIDVAVGLAEVSPATTGWVSNDYVGQLCAEANALPDPASGAAGRLIPFASINPYVEKNLAAELQAQVDTYGFKGIKVYPPYHHHYANDARMYPLYAKAEELGLLMLVHTGSSEFKNVRIKYADPLHLDDVAIDFPDLTILMAHGGRPFWYEQAFWMIRRHPNVYIDLSGLPGKNILNYFPRLEKLPDKFVYGSDWPGNFDLRQNIDAINNLPLRDETKQAILAGNAAKLLGMEV